MATPRIFVSSTCYDLQEIRYQLRNFIKDYGYESVLSEFDDIFYNYNKHVQDACLEEIPKCHLFILVVGNNYGSFYHKENQQNKIPDSVTLKEFRKAIDQNISKHIFINKYVDYDYKNYKRALDKEILKYFTENNVQDDKVHEIRHELKEKFDSKYHFPNDSYKFIFYFLDVIYDLKEGNAITTFESFPDIKESLKKQWAGLIYEALTNKNKSLQVPILDIETKLNNIEKNISKLVSAKTSENGSSITFNVSNISKEINIENLQKLQDKIQELLVDICNYLEETEFGDFYYQKRIEFSQRITEEIAEKWLNSLKELLQNYKWSKSIHVENLFKDFPIKQIDNYYFNVSYKTVLELYSIFSSLSNDDHKSFLVTICQELNKNFDHSSLLPKRPFVVEDDLPF